jgi:hypothetical protein
MSEETPLTPAQRIALVDKDRTRRIGQIVITFILIAFAMGFVAWYAYAKADDSFLAYMATGMLGVLFAGIGAAFSIMGLGRTVGSTNNSNRETIALILELLQKQNPTTPGPLSVIPDLENPIDDDLGTLEEERPTEDPPGRD